MPNDEELPSIDPAMLTAVTGGTTDSDQMTAELQQILGSLQDLSQNQNSSGSNSMMQMMPMMMMMMQQREAQAAAPVVAAPPPGDGWVRVS